MDEGGSVRKADGLNGLGGSNKMSELNDFISEVKKDFVQFRFREGRKFAFRPPRTIILETYDARDKNLNNINCEHYKLSVLHELGHALLGHKFYTTDPERLKMESEAWVKAGELCLQYNILYDEDYVEGELDTYREWLHQRSCCTRCGLTRYQTRDGEYHCPQCD